MAESVIIEFIADTSKLEPAVDQLEQLGVVDKKSADIFRATNAELKRKTAEVAALSTQTDKSKNSIVALNNSVKGQGTLMKMTAAEFKKTGLTLEQLVVQQKQQTTETKKGTVETEKTTVTHKNLRTEVRAITEQLTRLKIEGKENTAQYQQLSAQASKYRDALGDVSREVNRAASDTRKLDTLIEFGQGIAASFAIAQGAAALFGDDNKELQETLVKVTSAMALLNGLQVIGNILQKESNLIRLITNQQRKIEVITTNLQTAAQSKNIIVSGLAAGAMRVLNTVMSANPALLLVSAFGALAAALAFFSSRTKEATINVEALNVELENQKRITNENIGRIDYETTLALAAAKERGASEKELSDITINGFKLQTKEFEKSTKQRIADGKKMFAENEFIRKAEINTLEDAQGALLQLDRVAAKIGDDVNKGVKTKIEAGRNILTGIIDDFKSLQGVSRSIVETSSNFAADQAEKTRQAAKQTAEEGTAAAKRAAEERKEIRVKEFEDFKAGIEIQLLAVEKASKEEADLRTRLSNTQLQIDLENEKLSENQKRLLIQKFFSERLNIQKDLSDRERKAAIENRVAIIQDELAQLNISNDQKELLTVELLNRQRQLEVDAAEGNKTKEKEINLKFGKEIAEQRLQIKTTTLSRELELEEVQGAARKRLLQRRIENVDIPITDRTDAIEEIARKELAIIERKKQVQRDSLKEQLISEKDFQLAIAQLQDQELQIYENIQKQKTDITKAEKAKRLTEFQKEIEAISGFILQGVDAISNLAESGSVARRQRLDDELKTQENLREAGAITEKEFLARQKSIDVQKRKLQQQDAQREKAIALFQAFISSAAAVVKALPNIPLSIFVGALGAAQIAAIASRPIPKFKLGKKDRYEGPGLVAEAGAEIVEKEGRMFLETKPKIIWLGKKDKVYNPRETVEIMNNSTPQIDRSVMNNFTTQTKIKIDYDKIGKAVADNTPQYGHNWDEKGIVNWIRKNNAIIKYLDKRQNF